MVAKLLDGKLLATQRLAALKEEINVYCRSNVGKRPPCLVTILIGDHPASKLYVQKKHLTCQELGILTRSYVFDAKMTNEQLLALIQRLNDEEKVDGILVQLPLPKHLLTNRILEAIRVDKDVDGFHPQNVGKLSLNNQAGLFSCTPQGIMYLLATIPVNLKGKVALIIGASNIVGKPMAMFLINAEMTVLVAQKATNNLVDLLKIADLVISATGQPCLIKGEWLKANCIVIDVGMNRLPDQSLVGDVDFKTASERAAWITPVPGGVGPMTVAVLMENTWKAYLEHMRDYD